MESYLILKRQFRHKIDEQIKDTSSAIIGGNCADYVSYKTSSARIAGLIEAYDIFLQTLKELNRNIDDGDEDEI